MPFASHDGVRIHYQVIGDGPPLILQHGFMQSIEDWHEAGYVDALRDRYRLMLIDARGHGGSDKPHDEAAYRIDRRVADVIAVMDAEAIPTAPFWGYSMGGYYAYAMGRLAAHRTSALVIGAQHPFDRIRTTSRALIEAAAPDGPDAVVAAFAPLAIPMPDGFAARLRTADYQALAAMSFDEAGIDDHLAGNTLPSLLYSGSADAVHGPTEEAARRMTGARFVSIPGCTHMDAFYRAETVLPIVAPFLDGLRPSAS